MIERLGSEPTLPAPLHTERNSIMLRRLQGLQVTDNRLNFLCWRWISISRMMRTPTTMTTSPTSVNTNKKVKVIFNEQLLNIGVIRKKRAPLPLRFVSDKPLFGHYVAVREFTSWRVCHRNPRNTWNIICQITGVDIGPFPDPSSPPDLLAPH